MTVPREFEHSPRDGGFLELREQRLGVAPGRAQSISDQLDRRELGGDRAGDRRRLGLGRWAAKEGDMRFELDRVEVSRETTNNPANHRPKRLAWRQPERELRVSDFKILLVHVLRQPAQVRCARTP